MTHGSLFSGIGGFDLAAEWMGWENVFHCEWNEFGQKVLKHYWPNAISYGDITKTDFTIHRGNIDIVTGGFPCQPYSAAGKRKGTEDARHLWPEMLRAIREIQPRYVVGENVRGLTNWNGGLVFDQVQIDLEAEGFEVLPFLLPACAVNAPHRRDRIWFVAHALNGGHSARRNKKRKEDKSPGPFWTQVGSGKFNGTNISSVIADTGSKHSTISIQQRGQDEAKNSDVNRGDSESYAANSESIGHEQSGNTWQRGAGFENGYFNAPDSHSDIGRERRLHPNTGQAERYAGSCSTWDGGGTWQDFPTQPPVCGRNDELPGGLDGISFSKWRTESIKAYGNAVVPNIPYQIFKAIEATS